MTIQYIVLEGGCYMGISALGALYTLQNEQFYDIDNIKAIYASSIGSFIGTVLCLKLKWEVILNYIEERPWYKIINFTPNQILEIMFKKGIFDISFFRESLKNLLQSVDLNIDITLNELYQYSKIELHIFSTKLNTFTLTDFSYKTHPNMKIIEAIYKSSTLPFIFQPLYYEGSYYLDGGLINNYPVNLCIKDGADANTILGIYYNILEKEEGLPIDAHVLEFAFFMYKKFFRILRKVNNINLVNEIIIPCEGVSLTECKELLKSKKLRKKYLENGKKSAQLFLLYLKKKIM